MFIECTQANKSLYDTDYHLWLVKTVKRLENKEFDALDLPNLVEEVSDLSRREKRKLESLLTRLFEHLLKLKYWESERSSNQGHWEAEILNFRKQISKELKASPSLKPYLLEIFELLPVLFKNFNSLGVALHWVFTVFRTASLWQNKQIKQSLKDFFHKK